MGVRSHVQRGDGGRTHLVVVHSVGRGEGVSDSTQLGRGVKEHVSMRVWREVWGAGVYKQSC